MTVPADPTGLREHLIAALSEASRTHPCTCGSTIWSGCFHPGAPSHEERRADAVLGVIQHDLESREQQAGNAAAIARSLRADADRLAAEVQHRRRQNRELADMEAQARTERDQLRAQHDADLHQPVLRTCTFPGCLHQFDAAATMDGRPTRPEWNSTGWVQVRAVDGHACPEHVPVVQAHTPHWLKTGSYLVCSCGWESPPVRWRGYGAEAWKDHLLTEESR